MLKSKTTFILLNSEMTKKFPNVVTGMLKVFYIDVYSLVDPDDTLCFMTYFVTMKFEILHEVVIEPFLVSTSIGDFVVAKRVYKLSFFLGP